MKFTETDLKFLASARWPARVPTTIRGLAVTTFQLFEPPFFLASIHRTTFEALINSTEPRTLYLQSIGSIDNDDKCCIHAA